MESWEIDAREQIRNLVASYNALGDRGRFDELLDLFAPDAVMDLGDGQIYEGIEEIRTIFTNTQDSVLNDGPFGSVRSRYLQHHTATTAIAIGGPDSASGQTYFTVMTESGVDHWGRYEDKYQLVEESWRFTHRRVRVDGVAPGGWADQRLKGTAEDGKPSVSDSQRLLAEAEIRQLVSRYAIAMDRRDLDALVELFIPDVSVGQDGNGHRALKKNLTRQLGNVGITILHVGTHQINLEGTDEATGHVYCRAEIQQHNRWLQQSIRYDDHYRRVDGSWLFVRRTHRLFYGAEVGTNPLGLPPANWPASQVGWGSLPHEEKTWQDFQVEHEGEV